MNLAPLSQRTTLCSCFMQCAPVHQLDGRRRRLRAGPRPSFNTRPRFQWPPHGRFVRVDAAVAAIQRAREQRGKWWRRVGGAAAGAAAVGSTPRSLSIAGAVKLCIKNHVLDYEGHRSVVLPL